MRPASTHHPTQTWLVLCVVVVGVFQSATSATDCYAILANPIYDWQNTIDTAPSGATLCVPAGSYTSCTPPIVLTNTNGEPVNIRGEGMGTTFLDCYGERLIATRATHTGPQGTLSNLTLASFDGTANVEGFSGGAAIATTRDLTLDHVEFTNSNPTYSISVDGVVAAWTGNASLNIQDCVFHDIEVDLGFAGGVVASDVVGVHIHGTRFQRVGFANAKSVVDVFNAETLGITNSVFLDNDATPNHVLIFDSGTSFTDILLSNLVFKRTESSAVVVDGPANGALAFSIHNVSMYDIDGDGFDIDPCETVDMTNVHFDNVNEPVRVDEVSSASVTNMTAIGATSSYVLYFADSTDVTVENLVVSGCTTDRLVRFHSIDGAVLNNARLFNNTVSTESPLLVQGSVNVVLYAVYVYNNYGNFAGAANFESSTTATVSGSVFRDNSSPNVGGLLSASSSTVTVGSTLLCGNMDMSGVSGSTPEDVVCSGGDITTLIGGCGYVSQSCCSKLADMSLNPKDSSFNCTCKTGYVGDGYTCTPDTASTSTSASPSTSSTSATSSISATASTTTSSASASSGGTTTDLTGSSTTPTSSSGGTTSTATTSASSTATASSSSRTSTTTASSSSTESTGDGDGGQELTGNGAQNSGGGNGGLTGPALFGTIAAAAVVVLCLVGAALFFVVGRKRERKRDDVPLSDDNPTFKGHSVGGRGVDDVEQPTQPIPGLSTRGDSMYDSEFSLMSNDDVGSQGPGDVGAGWNTEVASVGPDSTVGVTRVVGVRKDMTVKTGVSESAVSNALPNVAGLGPATLVAAGGQAKIYRALSYNLGERIVIKVFTSAAAYEREVAIFDAAGDHPNLIGRVDMDGLPPAALALTLASHGDINNYLENTSLEPAEVIRIGHGIAEGLNHLHSRGICHLDIKPGNILLTADSLGKICPQITDFGASFVIGRSDLRVDSCTIRYAAPEVIALYSKTRNDVEIISYKGLDVFSFGMLLWELAVGVPPFHNLTSEEILAQVLADPLKRVDTSEIENIKLREIVDICIAPAESRAKDLVQISELLAAMVDE